MPNILALETSEMRGGVAVADGDKVLADLELDSRLRSAQSLAPAIRSVLERAGWQPRQVDLVAVTVGPGSFTGLRVGVATAKVFAYAAGAEVLGISTLEAIAAAAPPEVQSIAVAIDAQRGDVVAQSFHRGEDGWFVADSAAMLLPMDAWIVDLPPGTTISGPVLKKWREPFPAGVAVLEPSLWQPTAANVARLAHRDYAAGRRDDLWKLLPVYSRLSAAEEKWGKRGADG